MSEQITHRSRYSWDRYIRLDPVGRDWPFMRCRKITLTISLALVVLSLAMLLFRGLNFGVDFEGGIDVEVAIASDDASLATNRLRNQLAGIPAAADVNIIEFGDENNFLLRFPPSEGGEASLNQQLQQIRTALTNANITIRRAELVGPIIGRELMVQSMWAVLAALFGIMIYIWLRFDWNLGLAGLIALIHDVILVLGFYSALQISFSVQTVAAVLAMAGYSINDSVVVFDRLRENFAKLPKSPLADIIDRTLNEILSRSFMTAVTTLLAVLALLLFGGAVLRDFCWALFIGILVGTWSSIVIASPVLLWFPPKRDET